MAREIKIGYRNYPIDEEDPLYNEELVDLAPYGVAGQSYYSRPTATTDEVLAGIPSRIRVRKTLAEKLCDINNMLRDPYFADFFGGAVELYVEDGHRTYELQKKLYEEVFPHLVWQQNPDISDEELDEKLTSLIAEPSDDPERPSPHATGGAVDVILRYVQPNLGYIPGSEIPMGHADGETSNRVLPDYFELMQPDTDEDKLARRNRRAFYAIMTGKAFGADTQLQVNPTEWWHWSYGDQMWAKLRHQPAALYGLASNKA